MIAEVLNSVKAKHSYLDILCNNAGVYTLDDDMDKATKCLEVNLVS